MTPTDYEDMLATFHPGPQTYADRLAERRLKDFLTRLVRGELVCRDAEEDRRLRRDAGFWRLRRAFRRARKERLRAFLEGRCLTPPMTSNTFASQRTSSQQKGMQAGKATGYKPIVSKESRR